MYILFHLYYYVERYAKIQRPGFLKEVFSVANTRNTNIIILDKSCSIVNDTKWGFTVVLSSISAFRVCLYI